MKRILSLTRRAIEDYDMIAEGDRIAVGVSGGKDSLTLLCALAALRSFYPAKFELVALLLDLGLDGAADYSQIAELCRRLNVPFYTRQTEIGEVVFHVRKEKNPCSLCANMRRGALNRLAKELGCNKVALGHHYDDVVETFFLSLLQEGRISCFSPVTYLSRMDLTVLRPMIYVPESVIVGFARRKNLPIYHSPCPASGHTQREETKQFIRRMSQEYDHFKEKIFGAIQRAGVGGFQETVRARRHPVPPAQYPDD